MKTEVIEQIINILKEYNFKDMYPKDELENCVYYAFSDGIFDYKNGGYVEEPYTNSSAILLFKNNYTGHSILDIDLETLEIDDSFLSDEADKEIELFLIKLKYSEPV